ncbi:NAD(P)/FAD-dependent oxidoreductase [Pseudonocardia ailaonensis]|uniref:NAD(P)/FAD-dependent oxidoreductase n=1 Tax=Pseudonocardia ailaonensis TaxID=367279 RepID=A0ABN2N6G7_9PSEU
MTDVVDPTPAAEAGTARWLEAFFRAVREGLSPAELFLADASWRDLLALTGDLRTLDGRDAIAEELARLRVGETSSPVLGEVVSVVRNARTLRDAWEVVFRFETAAGRADGVVRLVDEGGELRAWTLMTSLRSLRPELARTRPERPSDAAYEGQERRNWLDFRALEVGYEDREPEVVIVGAGQCGLALAARLRQAGVDVLLVDRFARVGDNWRKRYHVLRLHNEKGSNHLPFMPFPENWPTYIPKDKLGDWLESYASAMELNVWTSTEFRSGEYDPGSSTWTVEVARDGEQRVLRPRHLVMAIGVSGTAKRPDIPGLGDYRGDVVHSSEYVQGSAYRDRSALVVGSGVSGHDIAQDLYWHGARVSIMQRSSTIIASLHPGAEKVYAHYRSPEPLDQLDLLNVSVPYPVKRVRAQRLTTEIAELDRDLLDRLDEVGFRTHTGSDGTGFQMQFLREGGGYYIDVGCSQLIAAKEIEVLDAHTLTRLTADGAEFADGSTRQFDVIVLSTGYETVTEAVATMLGPAMADRIGPVWGLDAEGELRNVSRPTAQEHLWFIAGGLAEARIYSQYLALQIEADLAGIRLPAGAR